MDRDGSRLFHSIDRNREGSGFRSLHVRLRRFAGVQNLPESLLWLLRCCSTILLQLLCFLSDRKFGTVLRHVSTSDFSVRGNSAIGRTCDRKGRDEWVASLLRRLSLSDGSFCFLPSTTSIFLLDRK
ncbi:hypothetical protein MA16_Dca006563 [Dendrobium catenatum]|uniref:Uncharacterized protein n=1 Tax=Dendrobium catenatum TaxID=906689 RepID=A0A2I0XGZ4_9ASPA|nr:hypothetical protein MA16_Dca006563 [Dendrobium catenatum]